MEEKLSSVIRLHTDEEKDGEFKEVNPDSLPEIQAKLINTLVVVRMMIKDCCDEELLEVFDNIAADNGIHLVEQQEDKSKMH